MQLYLIECGDDEPTYVWAPEYVEAISYWMGSDMRAREPDRVSMVQGTLLTTCDIIADERREEWANE